MVLQLVFPLAILLMSIWHANQMNARNRQALQLLGQLQADMLRSNRRADRQPATGQRAAAPHKPRPPRATAATPTADRLQRLAASPGWAQAEARYFDLQPGEQPPTVGVQQLAQFGWELLTAPVAGRPRSYMVKKRPIAGYTRNVGGDQQHVAAHVAGRRMVEQEVAA